MRKAAPGFPFFVTRRSIGALKGKALHDLFFAVYGARTDMEDSRIRESILEAQLEKIAGKRGWTRAAGMKAMPASAAYERWYTSCYDDRNKPILMKDGKPKDECRCHACYPPPPPITARMKRRPPPGTARMTVRPPTGTARMRRRALARFL